MGAKRRNVRAQRAPAGGSARPVGIVSILSFIVIGRSDRPAGAMSRRIDGDSFVRDAHNGSARHRS
jgi:hypothetical protein